MSQPPNAREVVTLVERFMRSMSEGKWRENADFYASDAVVEEPFGVVGNNRWTGEAIRKALIEYHESSNEEMRFSNVVIYETTDPEVVIVEYDIDGHIIGTGRTYHAPNIQVMRIRDGRIVYSKNYHHTLAQAAAAGTLQSLVAAYTGEKPKD